MPQLPGSGKGSEAQGRGQSRGGGFALTGAVWLEADALDIAVLEADHDGEGAAVEVAWEGLEARAAVVEGVAAAESDVMEAVRRSVRLQVHTRLPNHPRCQTTAC